MGRHVEIAELRATTRPVSLAALRICWTRWMLEAKQAMTTRPAARRITSRTASPAVRSDGRWPGTRALVESESMRSMPSRPASPKPATSVALPSTGVGSSFQSPVNRMFAAGVVMTIATQSGIECATCRNRKRNGPRDRRPWALISRIRVVSSRWCSSSLPLRRPRVSLVP
jgi:hypothetical protein